MPLDSINDLIINNQYLAQFIVDEVFESLYPEEKVMYYEDCMGVAMEALCIAAHAYNPERASFQHWALLCMKRAVWKYILKEQLRGITGVRNVRQLNGVFGVSNADDMAEVGTAFVSDENNPEEAIEKKDVCEQIRKIATETELQILNLMADGYDYDTIGEILYRDPASIRSRITNLRKKIADIA